MNTEENLMGLIISFFPFFFCKTFGVYGETETTVRFMYYLV